MSSIDEVVEFLQPYYPNTSFKEKTISAIEKALYHSFFKLTGKILANSSKEVRAFLKNFLMKYEIYNLKEIILGTILGTEKKQILQNVNFIIEELLENEKFIRTAIEKRTLNEIQLYMKGTKYYQVINEGISFFKKNKEIFVLNAFLDKFYYESLMKIKNVYNIGDFGIIRTYINFTSEIYNLKILYRGIKTKIGKNLLSQLIIDNYLFLSNKKLNFLLNQETIESFVQNLKVFLIESKKLVFQTYDLSVSGEDIIERLRLIYEEYFFLECKKQMNSLASISMSKILEIIVKKEREIRDYIIPKVVSILHEKYQSI